MPLENIPSDWSIYPYNPVKPLPILFAVIVTLLAAYNIYQNFIKYKWQRFGFIMTWASTVWIAGFICRILSEYHTQNIGLYIAQYVLILAGPPLYAASESFILGRLLAYLPYHAVIHPGRVVSTFAILSAVIEALAANGASRLANADADDISSRKLGFNLVESALILQGVLEVCFLSLTTYIWYRANKTKTCPKNVRTMFIVVILTSTMMIVRCIIRAEEAFEGARCLGRNDLSSATGACGYATTHEWILWVFEVANITLFVVALTIFTPGKYLPHSDKVYLDKYDGMTERLGPGFAQAEKRSFWRTVADPFNLTMIIGGKGAAVTPFWEERHEEYVGQPIPKDPKQAHWLFGGKKKDAAVSEGKDLSSGEEHA